MNDSNNNERVLSPANSVDEEQLVPKEGELLGGGEGEELFEGSVLFSCGNRTAELEQFVENLKTQTECFGTTSSITLDLMSKTTLMSLCEEKQGIVDRKKKGRQRTKNGESKWTRLESQLKQHNEELKKRKEIESKMYLSPLPTMKTLRDVFRLNHNSVRGPWRISRNRKTVKRIYAVEELPTVANQWVETRKQNDESSWTWKEFQHYCTTSTTFTKDMLAFLMVSRKPPGASKKQTNADIKEPTGKRKRSAVDSSDNTARNADSKEPTGKRKRSPVDSSDDNARISHFTATASQGNAAVNQGNGTMTMDHSTIGDTNIETTIDASNNTNIETIDESIRTNSLIGPVILSPAMHQVPELRQQINQLEHVVESLTEKLEAETARGAKREKRLHELERVVESLTEKLEAETTRGAKRDEMLREIMQCVKPQTQMSPAQPRTPLAESAEGCEES